MATDVPIPLQPNPPEIHKAIDLFFDVVHGCDELHTAIEQLRGMLSRNGGNYPREYIRYLERDGEDDPDITAEDWKKWYARAQHTYRRWDTALQRIDESVRVWRLANDTARGYLPRIAVWMDNRQMPAAERWTTLADQDFQKLGSVCHRWCDGNRPSNLDESRLVVLRELRGRMSERAHALKSIRVSPPAEGTTMGTASTGSQGALWFDENGDLLVVGDVPRNLMLERLAERLHLFLAKLETCERAADGAFLPRDEVVGPLNGLRDLWSEIWKLATLVTTTLLPPAPKEAAVAFAESGITAWLSSPERRHVPLADALRQLTFSLLYKADGSWVDQIPERVVHRLQALSRELELHRKRYERAMAEAKARDPLRFESPVLNEILYLRQILDGHNPAVVQRMSLLSALPFDDCHVAEVRDVHARAIKLRETCTALPVVPAWIGKAIDMRPNLLQWCIDAEAAIRVLPRNGGQSPLPGTAGPAAPEGCLHAEDFNWVIWYGTRYSFSKGIQAESVKALWESWRLSGYRGGCGLSEGTIRDKVGSDNDRFRLEHVFRGHQAFKTMIRPAAKGTFALFAPESPSKHQS